MEVFPAKQLWERGVCINSSDTENRLFLLTKEIAKHFPIKIFEDTSGGKSYLIPSLILKHSKLVNYENRYQLCEFLVDTSIIFLQ